MNNTYLIISDTHLRLTSPKRQIKALTRLIKPYKNIIINGDFYEAKYTNAKKFKNKHSNLLALLKQKNTIYIYGNHDPKNKASLVAKSCSQKQLLNYKLKLNKKVYHIEHGHLFIQKKPNNWPKIVYMVVNTVSKDLQYLFPFLRNIVGKKWNNKIILNKRHNKNIKPTDILVCGHTHVKLVDYKNNYINSGFTQPRGGSFIVIDKSGLKLLNI